MTNEEAASIVTDEEAKAFGEVYETLTTALAGAMTTRFGPAEKASPLVHKMVFAALIHMAAGMTTDACSEGDKPTKKEALAAIESMLVAVDVALDSALDGHFEVNGEDIANEFGLRLSKIITKTVEKGQTIERIDSEKTFGSMVDDLLRAAAVLQITSKVAGKSIAKVGLEQIHKEVQAECASVGEQLIERLRNQRFVPIDLTRHRGQA